MKRLLQFTSLAVVVLVTSCRARDVTEAEARDWAQKKFVRFCAISHHYPDDFTGPASTSVGGAKFAYEWKSKKDKEEGILVYVTADGIVEGTHYGEVKLPATSR